MGRLETQRVILFEYSRSRPAHSPALRSDSSWWQEEERRATSHEVHFSPHESQTLQLSQYGA